MKWRWLLIAPVIVALHQLASLLIFPAIEQRGAPIEVLPFFRLVEVWNTGVSFGMFNNLAYGQWLLAALSIAITLFLLRWLSRTEDAITTAALSLTIGGAIGNTIDRLRFGAVADYLDFHAFGYHWPAFNITDCAIVGGVGAVMIRELLQSAHRPEKKK